MKNGINVAAISELVHEIRHVEGESDLFYSVGLAWQGGLKMEMRTLPLRFGSKRVARDFHFPVDHPANTKPSSAPSPIDYFMTGVGSCAANVLVQGASYKKISVNQFHLQASAELSAASLSKEPNQLIANPSLNVDLRGTGNALQYKMMLMNVSRFSPNYVTAILSNSIDITSNHHQQIDHTTPLLTEESLRLHSPTLTPVEPNSINSNLSQEVMLTWRNGTQFDVDLQARQYADKSWQIPYRFSTDQPSAAAGLNEAPNPQEYLLAGVLSDVAQQLVVACQEQGIPLFSLSANIRCRLDMKGFFNLLKKSAVQLQDNHIEIYTTSTATQQKIDECIAIAKQRSVCLQSFVNACSVTLQRVGALA